jgi:transcription elongation factor Elf1
MKIKEITWQRGRNFEATYECEWCGHTEGHQGYDSKVFLEEVVPKLQCGACGKMSDGRKPEEVLSWA